MQKSYCAAFHGNLALQKSLTIRYSWTADPFMSTLLRIPLLTWPCSESIPLLTWPCSESSDVRLCQFWANYLKYLVPV